jgi:hypothetical protein
MRLLTTQSIDEAYSKLHSIYDYNKLRQISEPKPFSIVMFDNSSWWDRLYSVNSVNLTGYVIDNKFCLISLPHDALACDFLIDKIPEYICERGINSISWTGDYQLDNCKESKRAFEAITKKLIR